MPERMSTMSDQQPLTGAERLAQLRQAIGAIESASADLVRQPRPPAEDYGGAQASRSDTPESITYVGMPEGDDWMRRIPARYHDGQDGFDRRIMEELAAVGAPCYTLNDLTKARTVPQGIPIFVDWLNHLEERIPGPEDHHRQAIRSNLIRNLNDPAARGNRDAIDALINQLERRPPLPGGATGFAGFALKRIATKRDFPRVAQLIEDLPPEMSKGPLIEYLGKVKTPEALDIALRYLDTEWTYYSLKALIAMKPAGIRSRVEPHLQDPNAMIRRLARRALEKLPE
ncbi:hypothetical protein GCM10023114_51260 [Mycolicibacterium sediminis]|uniref:HEAT repeat domain-containing protein n=2 Tax=Mycolicibacterium sediminis TaxID=1286180 RepID=A0A7I7QLE2_9MYCO|nr:hypothetical protein MSEDJ_12170 [Mycolicibacterium sediminis]